MDARIKYGLLLCLCFKIFFAHAAKPNIVFILADDMGYGDVQVLNPERGKIPTPNLDRLAKEGMNFLDAHTGSSVCTPTRYGLLTGRYCWRTRLQTGVISSGGDPLIAKNRSTLASLLQNQGYYTACIGKWHLGFNFSADLQPKAKKTELSSGYPLGTIIPDGPITRGFNEYFGYPHAGWIKTLIENDRIIAEIQPEEMLPRLSQRAVNFIQHQAEKKVNDPQPFFLYLPLNSPHTPIVPSRDFIGKSALGPYGDFVMATDAVVGNVLQALKDNGLEENTLVFFSSDNGCSKEAHIIELQQKGHFPSAQFRGSKSDIWEGGHRVPFFVKWPAGGVQANSTSPQMISLVDVVATLAELLNFKLENSEAEDSISFLPALYGKKNGSERSFLVNHSINGKFALRTPTYKLILADGSGGWSTPKDKKSKSKEASSWQLYNMEEDPEEQINIISEHPEKAKQMLDILTTIVKSGRSRSGQPVKNDVNVDIYK